MKKTLIRKMPALGSDSRRLATTSMPMAPVVGIGFFIPSVISKDAGRRPAQQRRA
jgi:hypothetical protein